MEKYWATWHREYENSHILVQEAVDKAYTAARKELETLGFSVANDDRAEKLIAAIMEYLTESAD